MDERHMNPEQPPPRRVTIHDRRKVRTDEASVETAPSAAPGGAPAGTQEATAADGGSNPFEEQLTRTQAETAGYLDDLQRLKAEFDNYRKRIVKEQTGLVERAAAGLIHRLLPVLDNFELAVAAAEESRDFERMLKGIEMVFGELKEVLASEGLDAIAAKGKPFDPNFHEAAFQMDGEEDGEPYVAEELRSGYLFKGRVLRPAMVKVARRARR